MFCGECGVELIILETIGEKDEFCITEVKLDYTLNFNGEVLFTASSSVFEEIHNIKYSFELHNKELGCEGGYVVFENCTDCSYSNNWEDKGHQVFTTQIYNLADHGHTCGDGFVSVDSCPCGKEQIIWMNMTDCETTWDKGYADESGNWHEIEKNVCTKCQYTVTVDRTYTTNENCEEYRITTYTFGDVTATATEFNGQNHSYAQKELPDESFVTKNPDGSTTSTVTFEEYCEKCLTTFTKRVNTQTVDANGYVIHYAYENYNYEIVDGVPVEKLVTSGYVEYISVPHPNGKDTFTLPSVDYEARYDNGKETFWAKYEYVYTDGDYCHFTVNYTDSNARDNSEDRTVHHAIESTYVLSEGSKTCLDGLDEVCVCVFCKEEIERYYGVSNSHNISHSDMSCVHSIDCSEYGAVCGFVVNVYSCPCGERLECDFDSKCDYEISHYYVKDEDGVEHEYMLLSCAVSECGFKLVIDEVYSYNENCDEFLFVTLYVGISEDNTNFAHSYSFSSRTGGKFHGEYERVETITETSHLIEEKCSKCGIVQSMTEISDNIRTEIWYDYLDGGYRKNVFKYLMVENEYDFYPLLTRIEEYNVNGECTYWFESATSYPEAENGNYCSTVITTSHMNGNVTTYEEERHVWSGYSTCAPDEIISTCTKCGESRIELDSGIGHRFVYDEKEGCYVCRRCDLKSDAPGDGMVTLEDRTTKLGEGNNYVIAFGNEYGDSFVWSLMIVDTKTGELYPIDAIQPEQLNSYLLSIDALAIKEAATALGLGNCEYMVRLSFVTTDANGELEYAITLDPHTYVLDSRNISETGCEAEYVYKCTLCENSYTETKKGHVYDYISDTAVSVADGVLTTTYTSHRSCTICGYEYTVVEVQKYASNGMIIYRASYLDGNTLTSTTTYTYDYENGICTSTYADDSSTVVEKYNIYTGEKVE